MNLSSPNSSRSAASRSSASSPSASGVAVKPHLAPWHVSICARQPGAAERRPALDERVVADLDYLLIADCDGDPVRPTHHGDGLRGGKGRLGLCRIRPRGQGHLDPAFHLAELEPIAPNRGVVVVGVAWLNLEQQADLGIGVRKCRDRNLEVARGGACRLQFAELEIGMRG